MSEPMSATEIEDVLSSIRRLVSDDMRPAPRAAAQAAGDKLILTPALRVVQSEAENVAAPARAEVAPAAQTTVILAVSDAPPMPDAPPISDAPPMFVAVPRVQLSDPPLRDLGDVVASVGAAVDAAPDEWEAETGDSAPQSQMPPNPWSLQHDAEAGFVEVSDDALEAPLQSLPQAGAEMPQNDHFEYLADAEVTEVPGWAQQDGFDETDAPAAALHGTVEPDPVWADAAEASVIAELSEPDPGDVPPGYQTSEEDEFDLGMRFDEDVLRELVRDMLREELAGKMGERITRNIRKLVRAEIARALASQEFE